MAITISGSGIVEANLADNAVTLAKMASGTDGEILTYDASGNPVAVSVGTDGQVLTSTGVGSPPAFETAAGGGGGLEDSSQFSITTAFTASTGGVTYTNWSQPTTYSQLSNVGSAVTESSGTFTFPSTGIWMITGRSNWMNNTGSSTNVQFDDRLYVGGSLVINSSSANEKPGSGYAYVPSSWTIILDITTTATTVYRYYYTTASGVYHNTRSIGMTFTRLGDT